MVLSFKKGISRTLPEELIKRQLIKAKRALSPSTSVYDGLKEFHALLNLFYEYLEGKMDKEIRKIKKEVSKVAIAHKKKHSEKAMNKNLKKVKKELTSLEKADKKRDPACDYGEKMLKKKKKK